MSASIEWPQPVEALVPHQGRMSFLRQVLSAEGDDLVADLIVRGDGLFGEGDSVPAWLGVEYMAQAVAAWAGLRSRRAGGGPKLGFLLGSRRYTARRARFAHGTRLTVNVHCELLGDNGLGMFSCRLCEGDEVVAEAQLSVFEPPDAAAYLQSGSA